MITLGLLDDPLSEMWAAEISLANLLNQIISIVIFCKLLNVRKMQRQNLRIAGCGSGGIGECLSVYCCPYCTVMQMAREVDIGQLGGQKVLQHDPRVIQV